MSIEQSRAAGRHAFRPLVMTVLVMISLIGSSCGSGSRDSRVLSKANFKLAEDWTPENQFRRTANIWIEPLWEPGGERFAYSSFDGGRYRYLLVDVGSNSRDDLFDTKHLCSMLETENDTALDWKHLRLTGIRLLAGGSGGKSNAPAVEFDFGDARYRYDPGKDSLNKMKTLAPGGEEIISPDGRSRFLVKDGSMYRVRGPNDTVMVFDGSDENYRLYPENVHWSPDSRFIAFLIEDWREVKDLWLIDHYAEPRPALLTFKWPMFGEKIEQYELWIYDPTEHDSKRIDVSRWKDQSLSGVQWSPDSRYVYFERLSRDWFSLDLCRAGIDGRVETLIEERDKRQAITRLPASIMGSTGEILWQSWRDGWNHYYLYDPASGSESRITHGEFNAGRIVSVDEDERVLYFMGNGREEGRNPYYHHLYRIGLDGEGLKLLTPEDAEHEVYFPELGEWFIDIFSRADLPPESVVRGRDGSLVMEIEEADISALEKAGWKAPEIFSVKAADGKTDLWGVMFKPFDFDPSRKYPVITYGYPGKETEFLPFRFSHNRWITAVSNSLAQYGFIVVVAGNRGGSPERSYEYYNFGADDFRDYPVADKKAAVERLAERYPFIDIDRVGIMGASSGGFMAATALLTEPDFFKVAVSKCGPHDPALYYHHWVERYSGLDFRAESNNEIAANLKGKLLLVQGDMDRHVPPSLTYRLAYDLMMANKRFDMFIIPRADHFWGDNYSYVIRFFELYFVENLMGDHSFSDRKSDADIF